MPTMTATPAATPAPTSAAHVCPQLQASFGYMAPRLVPRRVSVRPATKLNAKQIEQILKYSENIFGRRKRERVLRAATVILLI